MELTGIAGIEYLKKESVTIRDKVLIGIRLYKEGSVTNVELKFAKSEEGAPEVVIELKNVKVFDFYYDADTYYIVDYKMLKNSSNEYYLSLDPYDYTVEVESDEDRGVIKAMEVIVKTQNN